jgi:YYY domain-containing protein
MEPITAATAEKRPRTIRIFLVLGIILLVGSAFRFYNVNWDKGTYHIHPDERHMAMVITRIEWPGSLLEYFDTSHSPLNARNVDMVYFYGTFPLFLTKAVGTLLGRTGYDEIHLVGRVLSALFDLASILLLFFLGRRLFDWRVGLIASFLLALTVLNIQGSHYFAVDTFLTFFVGLTIWFTLDLAEGKGWPAYLGLGLSMGLTLACKVSVFLLVVVVAVGGWLCLRRRLSAGEASRKVILSTAGGLALAAVVAIAVFRVAQPYAWAGPNYQGWDQVPEPWGERLRVFERVPEPIRAVIMPNPQWIADIVSAGAQQTGEADLPWGRQWTERTPWLWPLENMVLWGMGVPLGIAAWAGVFWAFYQLVRSWRRRRRQSAVGGEIKSRPLGAGRWDLVLIPLLWVLLTFLWQGMQYVKSVRYFLPIYPYLAMFAALLVISAWDWAKGRRWGAKALAGGLATFVLLGTLAWAFAFIQIYTEPVTRVQATRWMYDNIESGATLTYRTPDGETGALQIAVPSEQVYAANGQWLTTLFTPAEDMIATDVVMNNLTGLEGSSEGAFEVQLTSDQSEEYWLAQAEIEATFGGEGGKRHVIDIPDVELAAGQSYYLRTRATRGAPLLSLGAAIANEHFDDPLPFSMDGRIAFGSGPYRGLDLTLYDEDTPEKLEKLLDTLDQADYISMSSGRLWQSIPRLPMRYPVTTRYYELLFAGELGFEKVAEFHSYPRLFGIEFDDTWAEEQFTVYDHPKVLIYRKTEDYNRDLVRVMLSEGVDWGNIPHWLNPRDVPEWRREQARSQGQQDQQDTIEDAKNNLMLTEEQRLLQEQGGTWASIFDRNSLSNRWPTLSWLVLLGVLGFTTLPLTLAVFRWLPDRGYILARPLGVLLLAWLSWILTNLTPLHYSRGTIGLAMALIAVVSYGTLLLPGQRRRLAALWHQQKRLIFTTEVLFLVFFAIFWLIRWGNPDLWHAWKGGEKPMDFAYLNAVIKSTEFPPYDPWFAGGYLNYYYFGQVMVGTLIKLIGIVPNIAYNLVIPTWFAMTAMGAFSVTYNLVAKHSKERGDVDEDRQSDAVASEPSSFLRPVLFGLAGALLVAVLGNLAEIHLLLLKLGEGVLQDFQSTIPGLAGLVRVLVGTAETLFGGRALPAGLDEWYWNASRAIPAGPYESVITEFPFFTFLYADLHAHLIAMPLTFLSLALAVSVVKRPTSIEMGWRAGWKSVTSQLLLLFVWSLAIGAMRTTNTWDVPPHLLVVLGALVIGEFSRRGRFTWRLLWAVVWKLGLVFVLSWTILYWPFWTNYGSYYNSLGLWTGTRTPIWAYLVIHGLFLFAIVSYLVARVFGRWEDLRPDPLLHRLRLTWRYRRNGERLQQAARLVHVRGLPVGPVVWLSLGLLLLLEILLLLPGLFSFTRASAEAAEAGAHLYRGLSVFALGLPMGILTLLVLLRRGLSATERLWAYLVLLGLGMSLGVEVIVLQGDIGRMNTVFKFYLQVWLIWGVAAAAALAWMLPRVRRWRVGQGLWLGALAILLLFAALYPPVATLAKVRDRFDPGLGPGLDGWAYMETANYYDPNGAAYDLKWDLEAIKWLLDNVVGSPVILEGHAPEYRWGARYAINTGLPTVLGWNWHQRQQRAAAGDHQVWDRAGDVARIYNEPVPALIEPLLDKYRVRYIVVGPLEWTYYERAGLEKFEQMAARGTLQVAFQNAGVIIYQVND